MSDSPLAPALLVAMPQLLDPNFKRSVVLLIHHDDEGTFGLVVNQLSEIPVHELCESLEIPWRGDGEDVLRVGGPVQPNAGWVLFDDDEIARVEDANRIAPGLSVAGSLETLRRIAASPPPLVQMLLGYAGWGPHQLEDELAQGAWLVAPVCSDAVFRVAPDAMWEHVVRGLGIDPATLIATPGVH